MIFDYVALGGDVLKHGRAEKNTMRNNSTQWDKTKHNEIHSNSMGNNRTQQETLVHNGKHNNSMGNIKLPLLSNTYGTDIEYWSE